MEPIETLNLRTIHPFPARMAPHIAFDSLPPANGKPLRVLDPMVGSGTTVAVARLLGHAAYGCDTDPLAVLISRVWTSDIMFSKTIELAQLIQQEARRRAIQLKPANSYPYGSDLGTCEFIDYWFDEQRKKELTALSRAIQSIPVKASRDLFWCAFSRLIITKTNGASLAEDISHSRPHKVPDKRVINPIDEFPKSVRYIVNRSPFIDNTNLAPKSHIRLADARRIPFPDSSFDTIITSPPYLNAIDYIRCNKFTLVWMGHSISSLTTLRGTNIGSQRSNCHYNNHFLHNTVNEICDCSKLSKRNHGILFRYAHDANAIMRNISRVIKKGGLCKIIIGDCVMQGIEIQNSNLFRLLAKTFGFGNFDITRRTIEPNRRYLPAPRNINFKGSITERLHEETIISMVMEKKVAN